MLLYNLRDSEICTMARMTLGFLTPLRQRTIQNHLLGSGESISVLSSGRGVLTERYTPRVRSHGRRSDKQHG